MAGGLKVASFTVRATMPQSLAWKRAADAEGHASVGTWLAEAADRHLEAVARSGRPLPLAWRKGRFRVTLEDRRAEVSGQMSPPFGIYHGTPAGPVPHGSTKYQSLVYLPDGRIVATFRYARHCKALASELVRLWVRWGGSEPAEDPAPLLQRFHSENS
jgi:hypothetical protein